MKRRIKTVIGTELPMLAVLAFALGPWLWMLLSSIRPERRYDPHPLMIWPSTLTLAHHIELFERTSFAENLRDSLIVGCGNRYGRTRFGASGSLCFFPLPFSRSDCHARPVFDHQHVSNRDA